MAGKEIDKVAWLFVRDRRILSTRSRGKSVYYIPGGKREPGETDRDTLVREIREELSVEVVPNTIRAFGVFTAQAHGHPEGVNVRMACYEAEYQGQLQAAAEIEEVVWLTYKDRDKSAPVDGIIFDLLKDKDLID